MVSIRLHTTLNTSLIRTTVGSLGKSFDSQVRIDLVKKYTGLVHVDEVEQYIKGRFFFQSYFPSNGNNDNNNNYFTFFIIFSVSPLLVASSASHLQYASQG